MPEAIDDPDFEERLDSWRRNYEKCTGKSLEVLGDSQVNEVVKKLEEKSNSRAQLESQVFDIVLRGVEQVGNIVADLTSSAFPPGKLCVTAVYHLIGTVQKYRNRFTPVVDLFMRISPFLSRLTVYTRMQKGGATLDFQLRKIIFDFLENFTSLCGFATRMIHQSKRGKAKLFLNILFFADDSEVSDRLKKIEALEAEEINMSQTLTLEMVQKTEARVEVLAVNLENGFAQTTNRENIKKALISGVERLPGFEAHKQFSNVVENTGKWLFEDGKFSKWVNASKSPESPVFALEAPEGFGKSYLCSAVINHLRRYHADSSSQTPPVSVAFYFLPKTTKGKTSLKEAFNSMLWQFCENDLKYQNFVAEACKKRPELSTLKQIWEGAVSSYLHPEKAMPKTFFIVLDGITNEFEEEHQAFRDILHQTLKGGLQVRWLLTGTSEVLQKLQGDDKPVFTTVSISTRNQKDVATFVSSQLNDFSREWSDDSREYVRNRVQTRLVQVLDGDFVQLKTILEDIRRSRTADDVETILRNLSNNRTNTLKLHLSRLYNHLDPSEIEDLNEILSWTDLTLRTWPTVDQLKAVLYLKYGNEPLFSLARQIKEKYSSVLQIGDDGKVRSVQESLQFFIEEPDKSENETNDEELQPSEFEFVQRFLQFVQNDRLLQKFGSSKLSIQKTRNKWKRNQFDCRNGSLRVMVCCLRAICSGNGGPAMPVQDYAIRNLVWHIGQVDAQTLHESEKGEIIDLICRLFEDDDIIKTWLNPDIVEELRNSWIGRRELSKAILSLLDSDTFAENIPSIHEANLRRLITNIKEEVVLERATEVIAEEWLQRSEWNVEDAVGWILSFISMHEESDDSFQVEISDLQPELILKASEWAKDHSNTTSLPTMWYVRLAETFLRFKHYSRATSTLESCQNSADKWRVDWCRARIKRAERDLDSALQIIEPLIEDFKYGLRLYLPMQWKDMLVFRRDVNEEQKRTDEVFRSIQELFDSFPEDPQASWSLIQALFEKKDFSGIFNVLQSLEPQQVVDLFVYYSELPEFHHQITYSSPDLETILSWYSTTIKKAQSASHLRYYHGLAWFYTKSQEPKEIETAVNIWEDAIQSFDENLGDSAKEIQKKAAQKLATAYLQQGKQSWNKRDMTDYEVKVQKLRKLVDWKKTVLGLRCPDESLLLGRLLYLDTERTKEAENCIQSHLKTAWELLTDDNDYNDWQGYMILANALASVESLDEKGKNAKIAWWLVRDRIAKNERGSFSWSCDGCDHSWTENPNAEVYICKDCIGYTFEKVCYEKLKEGGLERRVCHHSHEFLAIPEWNAYEGGKEIENHRLPTDNTDGSLDRWLVAMKELLCKKF